jgi:hypothetical protein
MQLSTRWTNHLKTFQPNRLGFHNVIVHYQEGDKQKIARAVLLKDGTLECSQKTNFIESQITHIRLEFAH